MNNWKEVSLKDYCKTQYGYTASATDNNTGVKFVRITDIVPDFVDWNKVPYCEISERDFKKYKLNEGDIVAARTGATVGYAKQIRKGSPDAVFASYLVKLIPSEKVDKHFLGVLIESNVYREFIQIIAGGSAQPNANANDLTLFKFFLPPLPAQQRIASILSAYDDLIEVNNQRIKLLEETARELYKEWFVRMRFPAMAGRPGYKQAKFVKGVPEGWVVKKLGDVSELINRGISPSYDDNGYSIVLNQRCIRENRIEIDIARRQNKKIPSTKVLKEGDVLINSTGEGTLGRTAQLNESVPNLSADSHVTIARAATGFSKEYYGMVIQSLENFFELMALGSTGQTELGRKVISDVNIKVPPKEILDRFSKIVEPINSQVVILLKQNTQLRQIRDRLLPRLISGKLSLNGDLYDGDDGHDSKSLKSNKSNKS